jgi:chromosome segregation ATPase
LHLAEKRANDLERKLKASEKARKKAEEDAAGIEDLRDRLHAAENALSDKEEKLPKREAAMIACFETQSVRFSSNIAFSLRYPFFYLLAYTSFISILKEYLFF